MKFIHVVHCGITRTTGMNSFSRFSLRFLDDSKQFFVVSRQFLDNSFLDDSWTWLLNNFWVKHHGFLDGKYRRDEISKTSETY
ncbi:unnamed protein product [Rhizophagus irregularis]|nr:unnamed protein product [Rhizophagus irregularis]